MTLPYCPQTHQLCAHHVDYECHRRWAARPLPPAAATAACPGFLRDATRANIIHAANIVTGRWGLSLDEATNELRMAGRLDEIMGVPA